MNNKYPKVLLFGHAFDNKTGMGITLSNLFAEWPKNKIAIMAKMYDKKLCEKVRPCCLYLGNSSHSSYHVFNKQSFKYKIRTFFRDFYIKLGINELKYKPNFPQEEISLIKQYNPDIIFTALGSVQAMKNTKEIMALFPNAKLVIYIVDDWVNTRCQEKFLSRYWSRVFDKYFRDLLSISSGNLSICQAMSDTYRTLYGREFYPFHNPIDLKFWRDVEEISKYPSDCKSILYLGKINKDTTPCLVDMARVVTKLNQAGLNYVFDVYSPDSQSNPELFRDYIECHLYPAVDHEKVPELMKSYVSLFLPLGFSQTSRKYVRLSMPTKLTEYLVSGRPTILYCPREIALAEYVMENNCAFICTEPSITLLEDQVLRLIYKDECDAVIERAMAVASLHDISDVRNRFLERMLVFAKKSDITSAH